MNAGGTLMVTASPDVGTVVRYIAAQFGVEMEEPGTNGKYFNI